jgi:hypothetical protein
MWEENWIEERTVHRKHVFLEETVAYPANILLPTATGSDHPTTGAASRLWGLTAWNRWVHLTKQLQGF